MQATGHPMAPGMGGTPVSQDASSAPAPRATSGPVPAATLVYHTPVGDFIHSADAKAGTILAVLGIMFTLLAPASAAGSTG